MIPVRWPTLHTMMNQLGYKTYSVVGHDIGMWVGYALAGDYPADIKNRPDRGCYSGLAPARVFLLIRRRIFSSGTLCLIRFRIYRKR